MAETITCENCGQSIGRLETPQVHNDSVVCAPCWSRLSGNQVPRDVRVVHQEQTSKRWKRYLIWTVPPMIAGGVFMMPIGLAYESPALAVGGLALLLGAFPFWLYSRIRAWWEHD